MANPDQPLDALIGAAKNVSASVAERHHAFEAIVRRFEDLAFGCAFARLRDSALAEDAAQDAFLLAWERLDQLREPAAFAGWLRRLVLTQCHRRLRGRRLELASADVLRDLRSDVDHEADAEAADEALLVRRALTRLRPADRLVLILFYGAERSHKEIADWLSVPVTTVSRRLAHARRRLHQHTVDALSGSFRAKRTVAGEAFLVELSTRLRRPDTADATAVADLTARLDPDRVPAIAPPAPRCAYLVEDPASGTPIAYGAAVQTIFRPIYQLHLAIGEDALNRHAGDVLLSEIIHDMVATDAIALQHRTSTRHRSVIEFLTTRGFQVSSRSEDWRLAAGATGETLHPILPGTLWELNGLEELRHDQVLFESALDLLSEVIAEDPAARAFLPMHPDLLRRTLRAQFDGVAAARDGAVRGLLLAGRDDLTPNGLRINCVAVRRNERRKGLGSGMLAHLLSRHSVGSVRLVATAAPELAGWLSAMRFVRVTEILLLERLLRKTVPVSRELLDEYVGQYKSEVLPGVTIIIERHGEFLISKARDMRDVLLASSESEFFTRYHYGRGRFERDETGRVNRLVYLEGDQEFTAVRQ